ncbi:hypothetical protein CR513_39473, partial [Mucuna pruriens]
MLIFYVPIKRLVQAQRIQQEQKVEYEKIHNYKSSKEMWDTLALAYEGMSQKRGSRWKNNNKKYTKEAKDKTQVVCYECKKSRHFKSECPSLEKENKKEKKKPFIKKKKTLMTTWKDLDLSSSKDENEEANICSMANTTFDDEDDKEETFNDLNYLQIAYQELRK